MLSSFKSAGEQNFGAVVVIYALLLLNNISSVISSESFEGTFWQLTDIHWDQQYKLDGDPSKMCHSQVDQNKSSSHALNPGQYGTYMCDAPWDLVEFSIKGMAQNGPTPDIIFWTGDNSPHVKNPDPEWPAVFTSLKRVGKTLREHFPNATIIPVLGNHDAYPSDFYPSEAASFYQAYLIDGGWCNLLSEQAQEVFGKCGFYAVEVKPHLKVVVLNTNLYNVPDNLTIGEADPCNQFIWFEQQLQMADANQTKIILTAHIPPGFFERWVLAPFFNSEQNDRYVRLIHLYGHVILTHVYGHTHTDSFRIFATNLTSVQSVAFISPSVTPWLHSGGVNPSLRLYQYNWTAVQDYQQFYLNLSALTDDAATPKWQLLYQATAALGVPDLSAASLLDVHRRMLTDAALFDRYYFYNTVGHVFQECDAACTRDHLCAVSHLTAGDMQQCQNGLHLLYRYSDELARRFGEVSRRADAARAPREMWALAASVFALALIFAALAAVLFACRSNQTNMRQHSYVRINANDV